MSHEPIADAVVTITVFTSFDVGFFVGVVGVALRVRLRLGRASSFESVFLLGCSGCRSVGRKLADIVLLEAGDGFLFEDLWLASWSAVLLSEKLLDFGDPCQN